MQEREMVCIVCPVGCRLRVAQQGEELSVQGNDCIRGVKYAQQEFLCPMRTVTSSVLVKNSSRPLCAVKTAHDVPKASIPQVLEEIRGMCLEGPVYIGQVLRENIAGTGVDLVATASVS